MWPPYIDVVNAKGPKAIVVFDKFPMVQHRSHALDQGRRDESREKGNAPQALPAKTCDIWPRNPRNLTDSQEARLSEREHHEAHDQPR